MIEILRPGVSAERTRVALFDFDGTLSLIRAGWVEIMTPMMLEFVLELKTGEPEDALHSEIEDMIARTTGKETIYQMMNLADMIASRGGTPRPPAEYKRIYLDRLWERIKDRVAELRSGDAPAEKYLVPGSVELLERLQERGIRMYLASGTDDADMKEEARLLGLTKYFDGGVFGALDDLTAFSKALLVERIIGSSEAKGEQLLGFGDGFVEIAEVKKVGGVAVGVATAEPECVAIDRWKRDRLAGVGADMIIPNYLAINEIFEVLFPAAAVA